MSKIKSVSGSDDYKLFIDFDDGNSIIYNMQKLIKTIPYLRLKNMNCFLAVKFDDKSVYWDTGAEKPECIPLRISVDSILFSIRDS